MKEQKVLADIRDVSDIECLIRAFYAKAMPDPIIGFFFTHVARIDLEEHLEKIVSFWAMQLLGQRGFNGNPFLTHKLLNDQAELNKHHFDRWLSLFQQTVDEHFSGEKAMLAKRNAALIADKMHSSLAVGHSPGNYQTHENRYEPVSGVQSYNATNKVETND